MDEKTVPVSASCIVFRMVVFRVTSCDFVDPALRRQSDPRTQQWPPPHCSFAFVEAKRGAARATPTNYDTTDLPRVH